MEHLSFVLGGLAVLLAVISQLLTGFGFAMVLVPLLLLLVAPADAVVTTALLGTLLTTLQTLRDRTHVDRPMARSLMAWSLIGLPLGVLAMSVLSAEALRWTVVGVVLMALVVILRNVAFSNTRANAALAGLSSGALLTSTGINGPPLVALVRSNQASMLRYRATLAAVFCGQGWLGLALFGLSGKINATSLSLSASGLVALPIGVVIGERLFKYVDAQRLRRGIVAMLLLSLAVVVFR